MTRDVALGRTARIAFCALAPLLLAPVSASAQATQTWVRDYSISALDGAQGVVPSGGGAYFVGGWTASSSLVTDIRVVGVDSSGAPTPGQDHVYRAPGRDEIFNMTGTSDGGFVATGLSTSFGAWGHAPFFVKFGPEGELQHHRGYLATGREWGNAIQPTPDGGYIIVGAVDLGGNDGRAAALKIGSTGNLEWSKTYGPGMLIDVAVLPGGDYVAVGYTTAGQQVSRLLLLTMRGSDGAPDAERSATYAPAGYRGLGTRLLVAPDQSYLLLGGALFAPDGSTSSWLLKVPASGGDPIWERQYQAGQAIQGMTLVADGLLVASANTLSGRVVPWAWKVDPDGNTSWGRLYDFGNSLAYATAFTSASDGRPLIAMGGDGGIGGKFALVKTGADGSLPAGCPGSLGTPFDMNPLSVRSQVASPGVVASDGPFREVAYDLALDPSAPTSPVGPVCGFETGPVGNAGVDQVVDEAASVMLHGTATGPDGLSYSWQQIAGPAVALSDATTLTPSFVAPWVPGGVGGAQTLTFQLSVSANGLASDSTTNVTVKNVDHAPVAVAGVPQTVNESSPVTLDGTKSYDPDSDATTCTWSQTNGDPVDLQDANTCTASFMAPPVPGGFGAGVTLGFSLTVSDAVLTGQATTAVAVEQVNHPPVAIAGPPQTVDEATTAALNGTGSSDPDGDALSYAWTQTSGEPVVLSNASSATPTFMAPRVGPGGETLTFRLVVTDGGGLTGQANVAVTVKDVDDPPSCALARPSAALLWPPNHKMVPVSIVGVTDPQKDNVVITVTGISQDEPVNGLGDGDTAPDAVLDGAKALLRAERSGAGNGRVYRVSFTADDGRGESCTGAVVVGVPHNAKDTPVDDGQRYDSTRP